MLLNFWTARGYGKRHLRALLMSMAWSVVSGCGGSSTGSTASLASVDASNRDPFAQPPLSSAPSDAFSEAKAVARQLKYHPGHYIAMNDFDKQSDLITVASKPGVTGISKRYFWRDLEPTQGTYDFSAIDSDLQLLADHGMQLVVMVVDKSFDPDFIPTPDYLSKYLLPIEKGGVRRQTMVPVRHPPSRGPDRRPCEAPRWQSEFRRHRLAGDFARVDRPGGNEQRLYPGALS
jgi:hypothetical protein